MRKRALGLAMFLAVSLIGSMITTQCVAYKIGDDGEPVHEYIAYQSLNLYSNDEINTYFWAIRDGAKHEDLKDHVYDRSGACTTITHFWDADKGLNDPVDSSVSCADGENAWQKAQKLWGMAIGEYASGDRNEAYEYLGHVVHLLSDMTVPAHVHEDIHFPDDDCYEDWMTWGNAVLNQSELDWLSSMGRFKIPDGTIDPFFYLFYTTNQIGDFFPSDDYDGDTDDNLGGWMDEIYSELGMYSIAKPKTADDLLDNDWTNNNIDGDLGVIRKYCFLHSIRAVAALYELFDKTVSQNSALTVVIERIGALDIHDEPFGYADFFVRICINGFWFINEGNQIVNTQYISPGWAFARHVGFSGSAEVVIQVWDEDEAPNPDDLSDINPTGGRRDLHLTIDVANGAISGDITGTCGIMLTSAGTENDCSVIWFRILNPNTLPTANAGPDQTVDEGDLVELTGSFTDPSTEDTHTIEWDFGDGSPTVAGTLTPTHIYGDNGVYTVTLTVTDHGGGVGADVLIVTVNNVAPAATIYSMTQPIPQFVLPIVHTLTFTASFADPGWLDNHTATWDFGDGTAVSGTLEESVEPEATGTTTADHIYSDPGTYAVTLTITDDDGNVGTDTMEVVVASAEEAMEIINEYIHIQRYHETSHNDEIFWNFLQRLVRELATW